MTPRRPQNVSRTALESYLRATGWKLAGRSSRAVLYALEGDEAPVEVVLKNEATPFDLEPALVTLAQLSGLSVDDVVLAVRAVRFDVVKARLPDTVTLNETISLDMAARFVEAQRVLFATSATTELGPTRHFKRQRREALDFAGRCRFGHTFQGSFGFTFESPLARPVDEVPAIPGLEADLPLGRRVVQRLMRGLQDVKAADDAESAEVIEAHYVRGLNANMCDDIVQLYEAAERQPITFSVVWSPTVALDAELREFPPVRLNARRIELIQDAADRMRLVEVAAVTAIYGLVHRLRAEGRPGDEDLLGEREIVVQWITRERGRLNVHITLPTDQYINAVDAHRAGQAVALTGVLKKVGRLWHLEDITGFQVMPI